MDEQRWAGKIVLVTGASRGIGRAVAECWASRGARVILAARDRAKLEQVAADINAGIPSTGLGAQRGAAEILPLDVTDSAAILSAADEIRRKHNHLDVLVNNAGVLDRRPFAETDIESARWHMETNFFGLFAMTRAFLLLIPRGGAIVNVSSVIGKVGVPRTAAYCASKFAVCGFSQALRIELKPRGIHVLTYLPGLTDTDMARDYDQKWVSKTDPRLVAEDMIRAVELRKPESAPTYRDRAFIQWGMRAPNLMEWIIGKARK